MREDRNRNAALGKRLAEDRALSAREWIVVIEILPAMPPDQGDPQRLLADLSEFDPLGLISAERYALRARVLEASPEQALTIVLSKWRTAAHHLLEKSP